MTWKLLAARFENDDDSAAPLEQFRDVQVLGIYWGLPSFGLDRFEITVPANSRYDAYNRYDSHLGQRMALFSNDCRRPIAGNITEARIVPGNRVRYVVQGPGYRMGARKILRSYAAATSLKNVVENIVYRYMPFANNTNYDNIYTNSVTVGGWGVKRPEGSTPAEAIEEILSFSDASYRIRDFFLADEPFSGVNLQKFTAWYQPRVTTATPAWIVRLSDLAGDSESAARSLRALTTSVRIYHGLITGTITGISGNTITDSSATFISNNVKSGDIIENKTKGGDATIVSVDSETQITIGGWRAKHAGRTTNDAGGGTALIDQNTNFSNVGAQVGDIIKNDSDRSQGTVTGIATTYQTNDTLQISGGMTGPGGTNNGADERYSLYGSPATSDAYAIRTAAANVVEANVTTIDYWEWEYAEEQSGMDATQAEQYANSLLVYEPQQVEPIVITAPFIRDTTGARWPLWEVIAQMGERRTILISDLFPSAATLGATADRRSVFYITSLEYNGDNRSLRVGLDRPDRRLDARLAREKILGGAGLF